MAAVNQQAKNSSGCTPLHLACERCNTEVVSLLLRSKADPKVTTAGDPNKMALNMFIAAATKWGPFRGLRGVADTAKRLMQKSWAPKAVVSEAGIAICDLALWPAADDKMLEVAEALLSLLAECGLDRATVLSAAMLNAVSASIDQSPSADRRDDNRVRYAHTPGAVAAGLLESMRCALRLGANPSAADKNRDTALHILLRFPAERRILPADQAVGEAIAGTVRLFLEHGASINITNKNGEKPIAMVKKLHDMGEEYSLAWQELLTKSRSDRKSADAVSNNNTSPRRPSGENAARKKTSPRRPNEETVVHKKTSPRRPSDERSMQQAESEPRMLPVISVKSLHDSSGPRKDTNNGHAKGVVHSAFHLPAIGT